MEKIKGSTINADAYVGDKVKIESAKIESMKHGAVIRVISESIKFKGDDMLRDGKKLKASKILGLGVADDGKYAVVDNSNLDKFLTSKSISIEGDYKLGDDVGELIGVVCTVQKTNDGYLDLI